MPSARTFSSQTLVRKCIPTTISKPKCGWHLDSWGRTRVSGKRKNWGKVYPSEAEGIWVRLRVTIPEQEDEPQEIFGMLTQDGVEV